MTSPPPAKLEGPLLVSEGVAREYGEAIARVAPGARFVTVGPDGPSEDPAACEAIYFSGDLFPDHMRPLVHAIRAVEAPRWLHSFSAGVDNVFFQRLLERGVRLTTSAGAQAVPIAHTVLMYLLALSRDLPGWLEAQRARDWQPRGVRDLQGLCLGVVGLGPIGLEVARLGQALRMEVVGMRRAPRGDEPCETWPLTRLHELLARVDALVLALPLTDDTRRLLDRDALARMKPDAWLVNVGRGEVVEEAALVEALQAGRLGGAGLDVFEVEPLPEESPLWSLGNVVITPHSSGICPGNHERATAIFLDNLGRYLGGQPLRNEVG